MSSFLGPQIARNVAPPHPRAPVGAERAGTEEGMPRDERA